jgi:hypothetical protein
MITEQRGFIRVEARVQSINMMGLPRDNPNWRCDGVDLQFQWPQTGSAMSMVTSSKELSPLDNSS